MPGDIGNKLPPFQQDISKCTILEVCDLNGCHLGVAYSGETGLGQKYQLAYDASHLTQGVQRTGCPR